MRDNPLYDADGPAIEELKKVGIEPGKDFDIGKIDPGIARGLRRAVKEALIKLAGGTTKMKNVNGWIRPPDLGRYGTDYDTLAGIAMAGLGADLQEDTIQSLLWMAAASGSTAPASISCTLTRASFRRPTLPGPSRSTRGLTMYRTTSTGTT